MADGAQQKPRRLDRVGHLLHFHEGGGVAELDRILPRAPCGELGHRLALVPQRGIGELALAAAGNELLHHHVADADLPGSVRIGGKEGGAVVGAHHLGLREAAAAAAHVRLQHHGKEHVGGRRLLQRGKFVGQRDAQAELRRAAIEQGLLAHPFQPLPWRQHHPVVACQRLGRLRGHAHLGVAAGHKKGAPQAPPGREILQEAGRIGRPRPRPSEPAAHMARPARQRRVVGDQPDGHLAGAQAARQRQRAVRAAQYDDARNGRAGRGGSGAVCFVPNVRGHGRLRQSALVEAQLRHGRPIGLIGEAYQPAG